MSIKLREKGSIRTAPCGKYESHSQKCFWEAQVSFKGCLLQEDLPLCRERACVCLSFCKWNWLPSKHSRGRDFIHLKMNFFVHLLFIYLDTRWERWGNCVFSLISYIFAHNTFFLPAAKISAKLWIQNKTKPNTFIQYIEEKNLCHAEVSQSHFFKVSAISFLPGQFTISKAKFSPRNNFLLHAHM